jgi:hypothetical protein
MSAAGAVGLVAGDAGARAPTIDIREGPTGAAAAAPLLGYLCNDERLASAACPQTHSRTLPVLHLADAVVRSGIERIGSVDVDQVLAYDVATRRQPSRQPG